MTKADIIRMAQEAGMFTHKEVQPELIVFANLVASAARNMTFTQAHWTDYEQSIVAAEREACAALAEKTICDKHIPTGVSIYGTRAAKAIRARGNT